MLHVIEVRTASVTEAFLKRLNAFIDGYPVVEKPLMIPPSLEREVDGAPTVLQVVLATKWEHYGEKASQTVIHQPGSGQNRLSMVIEDDGNKAAFYIYHDENLVRDKTRVYIGYNSSLKYNGFLLSTLGLTCDDWRFVKIAP